MGKNIKVQHSEKECNFCGQTFTPHDARGIYCSKRCKDNASKIRRNIEPVIIETKVCKGCGKEFETQYKRKEFCCKKCADKTRWQKNHIPKPRLIKITPPIQYEARTCVICGNEFEVNKKMNNKTCSKECSKALEKEHRRVGHRNREKRIASVLVDRDISLETLKQRDNNICWICGKATHDNDYIVVNGTIIVGETYPSIDHLVPIARGGLHKWENIRLAHKGCNQKRGATLCDKVNELTREEARKFAREICSNKKEVIQFVNGVEYARYSSTREAAEQNGFKDKSIQNACRGKINTKSISHKMYGYEWKYAN